MVAADVFLKQGELKKKAKGNVNEIKYALNTAQLLLGPRAYIGDYEEDGYMQDAEISVGRLSIINKILPVIDSVANNTRATPRQLYKAARMLMQMTQEVAPADDAFTQKVIEDNVMLFDRGDLIKRILRAHQVIVRHPNARSDTKDSSLINVFYNIIPWKGLEQIDSSKYHIAEAGIDIWEAAMMSEKYGQLTQANLLKFIYDNRDRPGIIGKSLSHNDKVFLSRPVLEAVRTVAERAPVHALDRDLLETIVAPIKYKKFPTEKKDVFLGITLSAVETFCDRFQNLPGQSIPTIRDLLLELFDFEPGEEAKAHYLGGPESERTERGIFADVILTRSRGDNSRFIYGNVMEEVLTKLYRFVEKTEDSRTAQYRVGPIMRKWNVYLHEQLRLASQSP